jgi:alpha-tubulin suppressor-like RCC1 family protein
MPFIKNVTIFARKVAASVVLPQISAGYGQGNNSGHSLLVNTLGRVFGWGGNSSGQIGDNSALCRITPVSVAGAVKTFCKISAGVTYSLAIDKNGKAWAWGSAQNFALGNANQSTARSTPIAVGFTTQTFCKISAGGSFNSLAIDKNGRAWGWGGNGFGQLGDGTITNQNQPVSVAGAVKTFCEISAGNAHTAALDKNGRAWGWGYNSVGSLGDNTITDRCTPVSVAGNVKTFCQISAGKGFATLAIDKNGRAWGWGQNDRGQIGNTTIGTTSVRTPVSVEGAVKTFCKISAGAQHTAALDKNGRAWAWGNNQFGQLGDNSITSRLTPVSVAGAVKTFCEISAGGSTGGQQQYTLAIDKNGAAWGWGSIFGSFLGDGSASSRRTPVSVLGSAKTFCRITTNSSNHTIAIDKNGRVWGWGDNTNGKIGDNSTTQRATPVSVAGTVKTFCQIAAGEIRTLAIDKNGRAWGWGQNFAGQIGDNSTTNKCTPVSVAGATKTFCLITSGQYHSLATDRQGRVWGWGYNVFGQLGDNSITSRLTPVSVAGAVKTFCQISAGANHTLAIDRTGRIWSWGVNNVGQLGDNSITSRLTPVSILGAAKTFCQISGGTNHTLAIDRFGRAWAWGSNTDGVLGDNTTTSQRTPVSILGAVKTFCKIGTSLGSSFAVAIDKNGRAWAWGNNQFGQLGNNTILSQRTPVSVLGAVKTFCHILVGTSYVIAIDKNGRAWGWGTDSSAQLGQNTTNRLTPVRVCIS